MRRVTVKEDGTVLDDSRCYPFPPEREKQWASCLRQTTVWYEELDGPDGGWRVLSLHGRPCQVGTWLFGLEAEDRIQEFWVPLTGPYPRYIGRSEFRSFLKNLRLIDVCLVGGQLSTRELKIDQRRGRSNPCRSLRI